MISHGAALARLAQKMLSVKLVVLSVKSNTTEGVVLRVVITGRNYAYAVKANINLQI